jgi:hypothetical protein
VEKVRDGYAALSFKCTKEDCEGARAFAKRVNGRWSLATYGTGLTPQDLMDFGFPAGIAEEFLGEHVASSGNGNKTVAGAHGSKAGNGEIWDYGVGLVGAAMVADPGNDGARQAGSSATSDNAGARVDPGAEASTKATDGGYTVPKMRSIQLEASKLELPPAPSMVVGGGGIPAPANPEMVSSKLRETLGATTQSEWIATRYEKKLLVDKETVHYGPSRLGTTYADLEFGTEFSNVYTLDCEKRQFLRTKTIKWSDGWVQDMPMGDKWWPLQPSTTEMNAVYDAICPQLLATVSGTLTRVNAEVVESNDGDAVGGGAIRADRLEVKDGSALSGKIAEGKVTFKSSLGTIEVNVNDIQSFADRKLHLADGTVLSGAFAGGMIEIAASVGMLKVPADEIVGIGREGQRETGGRENAAAESDSTKAFDGDLWDYGSGLEAAEALAESGHNAATKVASSATADSAGARVDPAAEKSSTATVLAGAENMASPGHPGWQAAEGSGCLVWNPGPVAGSSVTWNGACKGNKVSGQGELVWRHGGKTSRYAGEMRDGKMQGRGTYIAADGSRYEGDWSDGEKHGRGTSTWPTGGRYEGEYANGIQHGHGVEVWPDGNRYEGEFVNGKATHGTLTFSRGNRYEGDFSKEEGNVDVGKMQGRGTFTWANPGPKGVKSYQGAFHQDELVGSGTVIWANGDRYEGEIVGGANTNPSATAKPNGSGKMTKANRDWYDGEWSGGFADGEGKAQIGGTKYTGTWARGCLRSMEQRAAWDRPRHECP